MGLETPLALLALGLGLLPILVHRIRRRDLPVLSLPTFAMLAAAQASQRRKRDLGDFLLLAVRIAILSLLALALASPYAITRVAFGDGQVSSVAIVIDDSMSMKQNLDGDMLLTHALRRADAVVSSLPQGSQAAVVLAGTKPRLVASMTSELPLVRRKLQEVTPSDRGTDLAGAMQLASQALLGSKLTRRRLLLLSDFAGHANLDSVEVDESISVTVEQIEPKEQTSNLSFAQVLSTPDPAIKGQIALAIKIRSTGEPPTQAMLRVRGGDGNTNTSPLKFHGSEAELAVSVAAPKRGQDPLIQLTIEAEDALAVDNHYEVLVGRGGSLRLLLVNGDPQPGTNRDELYYLQKALPLLPQQAEPIRVHAIDAASLAHQDLTQCDIVVLANVAAPDVQAIAKLTDFVTSSGGLVITGGDHVDLSTYNGRMVALLPGHLSAVSRNRVQFANLADSAFLPEGLTGLQLAHADAHLLLDSEFAPMLTFSDGTSAVSEKTLGRGHVVLFTSTLDVDWSDLALRPGYLALTSAMLRVAAGQRTKFTGRYAPGDEVVLPVPSGAHTMEVTSPSGEAFRYDVGGQETLNFTQTLEAGGYRVLASSGESGLRFIRERSFSVDAVPEESDLQPGPVPNFDSATSAAKSELNTVHHDLSSYLWLIAGALVAAEAYLRRRKPPQPRAA